MKPPVETESGGDLKAALLAESLATQNGFLALLQVLVVKRVVDRDDLGAIAKSMSNAFELPQVRGNIYVQQIQRNTDDFLADLVAKLSNP